MRSFTVLADRKTGEWDMSTLKEVDPISRDDHYAREDTNDVHYDTFEEKE